MIDSSENDGRRRPGTRPFVSGREIGRAEPTTSAYTPPRPFSFAGARSSTGSASRTTSLTPMLNAGMAPTPRWTVAVYEPGLEHVASANDAEMVPSFTPQSDDPFRFRQATAPDDYVEASLALAEDVVEAQRHASSLAAAELLESVAQRLRRGEILLLPGASTKTDAAVVSAVLAALLGGRR